MESLLRSPDNDAGLSEHQIAKFSEDGFLVIDDVFSSEDVDNLREASVDSAVKEAQDQKGFAEDRSSLEHYDLWRSLHGACQALQEHRPNPPANRR